MFFTTLNNVNLKAIAKENSKDLFIYIIEKLNVDVAVQMTSYQDEYRKLFDAIDNPRKACEI